MRSALKRIEQGQRLEADERPSGCRGISPRPAGKQLPLGAGGKRASGWHVVEEFELDGFRYRLTRKRAEVEHPRCSLTKREWQVLTYASRGHKNKSIAEALGLAPSTIGVLLSRAARKLGTKSRKELMAAFSRLKSGHGES